MVRNKVASGRPRGGPRHVPYGPSVDRHRGVKPDFTDSTHVDTDDGSARKALYPCKEPGTLGDEPLDFGVDFRDPRVERLSFSVACCAKTFSGVRVTVDDSSPRKRPGEASEYPNEIDTPRPAPRGGSVAHEMAKLLGGLAIDPTLTPAHPELSEFPKHGRSVRMSTVCCAGAETYQLLSSSPSFHRS